MQSVEFNVQSIVIANEVKQSIFSDQICFSSGVLRSLSSLAMTALSRNDRFFLSFF